MRAKHKPGSAKIRPERWSDFYSAAFRESGDNAIQQPKTSACDNRLHSPSIGDFSGIVFGARTNLHCTRRLQNIEKSMQKYDGIGWTSKAMERRIFDECERWCLVVQHHAQERSVDLQTAVVLDEAQFPELVHEEIDP
jgi:hypothetical protein